MNDLKRIKQIIENFEKMQNSSIKIGVTEESNSNYPNGQSVAFIGSLHEYGITINVTDRMRGWLGANKGIHLKKSTTKIEIPKRSFLRDPFFENKDEIQKVSETLTSIGLENPDQALELYAIKLEGISKASFTSGNNEPLKARQGTPLVDTGKLRSSISYKIEKK